MFGIASFPGGVSFSSFPGGAWEHLKGGSASLSPSIAAVSTAERLPDTELKFSSFPGSAWEHLKGGSASLSPYPLENRSLAYSHQSVRSSLIQAPARSRSIHRQSSALPVQESNQVG